MPKYIIEREIPDAGKLSQQQLQAISQKSCGVLQKLGPQVQWVESFVTDDKIYSSTSHRMKRWSANTPAREGFRPIESPPSGRSSVRRRRKVEL
jgi:hypothetical protein